MHKLSEINIYPIKSLSGISLQTSEVEERGLKYDRRWVLVDKSNTFFTQRDFPEMALIKVSVEPNFLKLKHKIKNVEPLIIPFKFEHSEKARVVVWNDSVKGEFYNNQIDQWFSDIIGISCRLVKMPESTKRVVNKTYARNKIVSFADGYPFLIIGEESLNDLNRRMESPLPMNRFRTNFVFGGGKSFDEDKWKKIAVGNLEFLIVIPCARCVITTVDQETGIKGKDPLKTLASFRKVNGKVLFGQNMVANSIGNISVGDEIKVVEWK